MSRRRTVGSAPKRDLRRILGTLIILGILIAIFGLFFALMTFHPENKPGFTHVPRKPYTPAVNPIALAELGLPPDTPGTDRTKLAAKTKDKRVTLVSVRAGKVELSAGGRVVRSIPTQKPPADLDQLATLIADGRWLDRVSPGHFVLKSALVVYGVPFTFGGRLVKEIALMDQFSVFIGTLGGTVTFDDVRVRVIDTIPTEEHRYRPFVVASKGSKMTIRGSEFSGLGWDWNASYGVSWVQGATGEAVDSTFEKGFIGVYTARAIGVSFLHCEFRDNDLYGLDPHTYSRNLTVDDVVAEGNGAHGIIFSDHVTDSTISNSLSRDNGENGIMMDKQSTGNRIENNTVVDNRGDGLVVSDSPDNDFVGNTVESNRVGVRASPPDPPGTVFRGNRIVHNGDAAENISLSEDDNVISDNGGDWNSGVLRRIVPAAAVALVVFGIVLLFKTYRRLRRIAALQQDSPVLQEAGL